MKSRLSPLPTYASRSYPKAGSTALGRILMATSMAATSLGGCGPAVDRQTVDAAVDKSDLDGTLDQTPPPDSTLTDQVQQDTATDQAAADAKK